ncbi:UDP-N-acetylglucosamine--LPS N-acetylglucosamine transferase [Clostridium sp. 19966]|uniref:MGDG synthase family glycosyltransferase n=1 Tax=Clostridium sp. 19966 TaxID=2768166 RepID=UPI0028DF5987|nr:glycosyltransferase [Clostridium sp. 19966]MDT8715610.1 UDP-N-acetylglucosamine--LPS N-acetylglucosamine transferase [Clostridium sp. 19966]
MRTLILSISAGGGHVNAAEAIESYIKLNNPNAVTMILDTYKYINPFLDKVVIGGYLKSLKFSPAIFGKLYKLAETDDSIASFSNKINEMIIHKLIPLLEEFKPDIIVTTHAFSTEMMSLLKSKYTIDIPVVTIMTDYAPHSFWLHPHIDAYVISNDDMVTEMIDRGIPRQVIYPLGIPVKPEFITKYLRDDILSSLNLDINKNTLLLMGGSLGMGKITELYQELQYVNKDIQIIIITGNNKKLYSQLRELSKTSKKTTKIIGYTNEVNKYMQASDLLITKPGGLTITEALVSHTPLAIFSAIPGQEEKNAEFLMEHNLAIDLSDCKNCSDKIDAILDSESSLSNMKTNCIKYAKPNSGNDIYDLLLKLISKEAYN